MSTPLSNDLRIRLVNAHLNGEGTYVELAARFGVGEASISRILARYRRTGSVEPDPHGGGNPALIPEDEFSTLYALVQDTPDATHEELAGLWEQATGISVSRSAIHRALRRAGITRKKNAFGRGSSSDRTSRRPVSGSLN
jgi:transposase